MSADTSLGASPPATRESGPRLRPQALGSLIYLVLASIVTALVLVVPVSSYSLNLLTQASTYAVAVLGLTVVLGYAGQINLAQAAFFGLGAYCVALGTTTLGLSFWIALPLGAVFAAGAGAVLGLTSLRLGGHYLAMVTISFQMIVTLVLTNWISVTHGPDGVPGIAQPTVFGMSFSTGTRYLALCVAILCAVGYFVWRLRATRLGRAMQAVRDNELAAGVTGVNTYLTKVLAFTICALLGGLGGGLFAGGFTYISPDQFSFSESVVFLTMALLGGARSPFGTAFGTGLLILLPEWLRFLKLIYLAVYGAAVILIMVFMPEGIWGFVNKYWRKVHPARPIALEGLSPLPLTLQTCKPDGSIILSVRALSKHFGGLKAVDGVDLSVAHNTVHALIGPNGSGKSTLLNVLSGIYRPTAGSIDLGARDISRLPTHQRAACGLGRTFQNIRLFSAMSILDNVKVGAERRGNPIAGGATGLEQHALAALAFVGLAERAAESVGSLSYGHQRHVEIARALAANPSVLLLDEPGAGLNHLEKDALVGLLQRLKGHGLTILIIDHDMNLVEQVADHITVLNFGRQIADGVPVEVLRNPEVIAAYLGEVRAHGAA
jgi:branched-chain amino acid transport system permease protein